MLLSLGVSYTNELDQRRALSYLHTWLANHAKHGPKVANMQHPEDTSQKLSWVISLFETAAASAPADADVQVCVNPCTCHPLLLGRSACCHGSTFESCLEDLAWLRTPCQAAFNFDVKRCADLSPRLSSMAV